MSRHETSTYNKRLYKCYASHGDPSCVGMTASIFQASYLACHVEERDILCNKRLYKCYAIHENPSCVGMTASIFEASYLACHVEARDICCNKRLYKGYALHGDPSCVGMTALDATEKNAYFNFIRAAATLLAPKVMSKMVRLLLGISIAAIIGDKLPCTEK